MDCSDADAMLDELALDVLPGDRRAALLAHVEDCATCRRTLDQLCETADALLLAGPVAAPPPGFDDRVLARFEQERGRGRGRRQVRLPAFAAAAAAAALLAVGGLTGALLRGADDTTSAVAARRFKTVDLVSTTGADVGDVATYYGRSPWYVMQLNGVPDGTYQCVLELDDGTTVPMGRLQTFGGGGGWGGAVPVEARRVRLARLVDASGTTVATARLA